jgi:hypothetical protein
VPKAAFLGGGPNSRRQPTTDVVMTIKKLGVTQLIVVILLIKTNSFFLFLIKPILLVDLIIHGLNHILNVELATGNKI